jgi:methanogenic corrinoid protein MtbC1
MPVPVVLPGSSSGPLRARPSGTLPLGGQRLSGSSGQWAQAPAAMGRELRSLVQPMLRAFVTFDTFMANQLIDEALSARSVEAMCVGLLIPALNRVSDLWGRNELSIPEERFATNFVRARLFSIFARTAEQPDAPLAVMACGPREVSDLNALVLATFWRRAGIRVVFLGQDVDGPALVHDVRMRRPRLVCVAIASSQRLRALSRIAKSVSQIETPTPLFTYSGAPFARNPELRHKISGIYLGDDPATATWHAMRLLSAEMRGTPPAAPTGGMGQVG